METIAKLILLRGNSGSGKSTAARALQRRFGPGTLLVGQDTVRREMLRVKSGEDVRLLAELVWHGRKNCSVTILEGILDAGRYRALFQAAQQAFGAEIYAYYYDIPFQETLRRHQTKPNRADFGPEEMRRWWKEQDYIGFIPERTLTAEVSLEEAVEQIWQDVTDTARETGGGRA